MSKPEAVLVAEDGTRIGGGYLDADGAIRWPKLELEEPKTITGVVLPSGELIPADALKRVEDGDICSIPPGTLIV